MSVFPKRLNSGRTRAVVDFLRRIFDPAPCSRCGHQPALEMQISDLGYNTGNAKVFHVVRHRPCPSGNGQQRRRGEMRHFILTAREVDGKTASEIHARAQELRDAEFRGDRSAA